MLIKVRCSGCGLVVRHIVTGDDPNKDDDISEYSSDDATSCIPPKKTSRLRLQYMYIHHPHRNNPCNQTRPE